MKQVNTTSESPVTTPDNLRAVIAANITELRKSQSMTQQDLAARLNYTDKAISKWERGESVPDIVILKQIADMFGVTVDYLLCEVHDEPAPMIDDEEQKKVAAEAAKRQHSLRARGFVTGMSILIVWMAALILFIIFDTAEMDIRSHGIVFACAVPASLIVWLTMNSIWFNRRRNYLIISMLMWSLLILAFALIFLFGQRMLWLLFLLGIPGQAIIVMWSHLKQHGDE